MRELDLSPIAESGLVVDLAQYMGLWAIEEQSFFAQWNALSEMGLQAYFASGPKVTTKPASTMAAEPGIAVIEIRGTMTKNGSSMSRAGATTMVRRDLRNAKDDPNIGGALFLIESPGGTVAGTEECAADYAALAAVKPAITLFEDQGCSAALWCGCMGRKVYASNAHSMIGSMGAMLGLYDMSGAAGQQGIKPIVLRTGSLKGTGFPGTEISDEQKAMLQAYVDAAFSSFSSAVQSARRLSAEQMKELSRGGVYPAKDAVGLGLIDGIRSREAAVAELRQMVGTPKRKGVNMTETTTSPQAASLTELEAACKGASSDFLVAQMRNGATVQTASGAWMNKLSADNLELQTQLKASQEENAKLKTDLEAEKAKVKTPTPGTHPAFRGLPTEGGATAGGTAKEQFSALVAVEVKGGMDKRRAISKVTKENPELHSAYLAEVNGK